MGMFTRSGGACPLIVFSIAATLVGAAGTARAAPMDCWSIGTLAEAIAVGTVACGSRQFSDFTFTTSSASGATALGLDEIALEFSSTRFGHAVALVGNWDVPVGDSVAGTLSFRFEGMRVESASVGLYSEWEWPEAAVSGRLCPDAALPCEDGVVLPHGFPPLDKGPGSVTVSFVLSTQWPRPELPTYVATQFSIPEPGTSSLILLGLAGLASARRRRADLGRG